MIPLKRDEQHRNFTSFFTLDALQHFLNHLISEEVQQLKEDCFITSISSHDYLAERKQSCAIIESQKQVFLKDERYNILSHYLFPSYQSSILTLDCEAGLNPYLTIEDKTPRLSVLDELDIIPQLEHEKMYEPSYDAYHTIHVVKTIPETVNGLFKIEYAFGFYKDEQFNPIARVFIETATVEFDVRKKHEPYKNIWTYKKDKLSEDEQVDYPSFDNQFIDIT